MGTPARLPRATEFAPASTSRTPSVPVSGLRRAAALGCAVLTLGACSDISTPADFVEPSETPKVVRKLTDAAGTERAIELSIGRREATMKVLKSKSVESWTLRTGQMDPARDGFPSSEPAAGLKPFDAKKVDAAGVSRALVDSDVWVDCTERGVHAQVLATLLDDVTLTHLSCLDTSRHQWLGPDLTEFTDLDMRSSQGVNTGFAELNKMVKADRVYNVSLHFGENAEISYEIPGACGNPVECKAMVVGRNATVEDAQPPIATTMAQPRLNYAEAMPLSAVNTEQLHGTISQTMKDHGLTMDGSFVVTIYQVASKPPMMEYKTRKTVFYTDLGGRGIPDR